MVLTASGCISALRLDSQMNLRQADYCSYREINTVVCSWNIDSAKPSELGGSEANTLFLEQLLNSVDSPDVIVFGFQEVIPLTDKKLTASECCIVLEDEGQSTDSRNAVVWRQA